MAVVLIPVVWPDVFGALVERVERVGRVPPVDRVPPVERVPRDDLVDIVLASLVVAGG